MESSLAEWNAWSPPGNFISGHLLTLCNTVCLLSQAQSGSSRMPHTCREAAQIPWPVRYRLRLVQSLRLRSNPGWQEVGSVIKNVLGISCLAHMDAEHPVFQQELDSVSRPWGKWLARETERPTHQTVPYAAVRSTKTAPVLKFFWKPTPERVIIIISHHSHVQRDARWWLLCV